MGKIIKLLFSRGFAIALLITLQVIMAILLLTHLSMASYHIYNLFYLISFLFMVYLFSSDQIVEYKLVWAVVVMLFPMLGGIFYLLWGKRSTDWRALRDLRIINEKTKPYYDENDTIDNLLKEDRSLKRIATYLKKTTNANLYSNCKAEYYKNGEEFFEPFLQELRKAQKFICMEYFILEEGKLWDSVLDILTSKVKNGVEVFLMYDDAGCIDKIPSHYDKYLQSLGIKAVKFNKLSPKMYTLMNYRDHRKITIIDGKVAFTGGLNMADEYINETHPFGYWKDTAVKVQGDVVWEYTLMFFKLWTFTSRKAIDIHKYKSKSITVGNSYTQFFGDDPLDQLNVSEDTYINIISRAKDYVYISTPYLIIDSRMLEALQSASRSGIDVRIITPGIPDKKIILEVTRSYYRTLLKSGIKIYEYTPGFIHAKSIVSDDDVAIVGTVNMDYRSMYLHFECGAIFYKGNIPIDVKKDIDSYLPHCQQITMEDIKNTFILRRFFRALIRIIAPLL